MVYTTARLGANSSSIGSLSFAYKQHQVKAKLRSVPIYNVSHCSDINVASARDNDSPPDGSLLNFKATAKVGDNISNV